MSSSIKLHILSLTEAMALCFTAGCFLAFVPQYKFFGEIIFFLEVVRSFPQIALIGFLLGTILGALMLLQKRKIFGSVILIASLFAIYQSAFAMLPFYRTDQLPIEGPFNSPVSLLFANLEVGRADSKDFLAELLKEQPDLVFVSEATHAWLAETALQEKYPYAVEYPGRGVEGSALYSRFPLEQSKAFAQPPEWFIGISTIANIDAQRKLRLLLLHAPPPHVDRQLILRTRYFQLLSDEITADDKLPLVVAGDFNASILSDAYKTLVSKHQLRNAAAGFGFQTSWHIKTLPFVRSLIDYALVRGNFRISEYRTLRPIGSDHLPVLIRTRL